VSKDDEHYRFIRQYAPTLYKITNGTATDSAVNFTDEYGRTYTAWADSYKEKGATIYAKDYDEAVATYENVAVDAKTLSADLGISGSTALELWVDGEKVASNADAFNGTSALGTELRGTFGGRGSVVEVYDITSGSTVKYKVVVINTYVAVVGNIQKDAKTVTLSALNTSSTARGTAVASVEGLTKGDVVSFNIGKKLQGTSTVTAYNVTKLDSTSIVVDATGTDKTDTYIRVGDTKYFASANYGCSATVIADTLTNIGALGTADVYLDTYGNILYVEAATAQVVKQPDGYFYVLATRNTVSTALGQQTACTANAKVLDLDTGRVSVINKAIINDKGTYKFIDEFGKAGSAVTNDAADVESGATVGYFGYYVMDDGSYVLKAVSSISEADVGTYSTTSKVIIAKGSATVLKDESGSGTNFAGYATATTKLTTIAYTDIPAVKYTPSTVTGYTNFPKVQVDATTAANTKTLVIGNGKTIDHIYVLQPKDIDTTVVSDPYTYGLVTEVGEVTINADQTKTYHYTFNIKGQTVTYETDHQLATSVTYTGSSTNSEASAEVAKNNVYKLTVDGPVAVDGRLVPKYYNASYNAKGEATITQVGDGYIVVEYEDDGNASNALKTDLVYLDEGYTLVNLTPDADGLKVGATVHVYISAYSGDEKACFITVE
jgi:hypothetical protein